MRMGRMTSKNENIGPKTPVPTPTRRNRGTLGRTHISIGCRSRIHK